MIALLNIILNFNTKHVKFENVPCTQSKVVLDKQIFNMQLCLCE